MGDAGRVVAEEIPVSTGREARPTDAGDPLRIVQSLLGHSTTKMTERYAHLAPGQSAGFMHLLNVEDDVAAPGPRSGPRHLRTDPN
jgi:hypothetical protein